MPQPRRAAGGATTEKQIPSLANNGYFSDYYLAHRLDAGLADLYTRWDELDKQGEPNERTRVRNLTVPFGTYRADAALTAPTPTCSTQARSTWATCTPTPRPRCLR